jgi:hypothetical protein
MKIVLLITIFHLLVLKAFAQNTTWVIFSPRLENQGIDVNSPCSLDHISLQVTKVKFYISDFSIFYKGKTVATSPGSYQLIDMETPQSSRFPVIIAWNEAFDHITFKVGVDSATSVSGAFEGALDPMNGMYWTWQSGYINFKLEGISPECPTAQNKFQLHIGGYQSPFNMLREISLPINRGTENEIRIDLNLDSLLSFMFSNKIFAVMSPNQTAMRAADYFQEVFRVRK